MNLLTTIAENECFALQQEAADWQHAVKLGCALLERSGFASREYYDGIIASTAEYGPYYVIAPHFAMPHARPECGALHTGFSLVTLSRGVCFGSSQNDPVYVVLTLVAKNAKELNEHALVQVMELLEHKSVFAAVRNATCGSDLVACSKALQQK